MILTSWVILVVASEDLPIGSGGDEVVHLNRAVLAVLEEGEHKDALLQVDDCKHLLQEQRP